MFFHWPRRDPQHQGLFNFEHSESVIIGAPGYTDVNISSGMINLIYRLLVSTASPGAWRIKIFDRDTMADDDRAWDSGARTGAFSSITDESGLIAQPDKDGTNEIHMRVYGTVGATIDITFNLVRMR